jgi:hypothetical protein
MEVWTGYIWFRIKTSAGICAHDDVFLGVTYNKFLHKVSNHELVK